MEKKKSSTKYTRLLIVVIKIKVGFHGQTGLVMTSISKNCGQFLPTARARKYVRNLNLASRSDWQRQRKILSTKSDRSYKNKGWVSWGDWLGTGNIKSD